MLRSTKKKLSLGRKGISLYGGCHAIIRNTNILACPTCFPHEISQLLSNSAEQRCEFIQRGEVKDVFIVKPIQQMLVKEHKSSSVTIFA